jgi:hypothetical protein
LGLGGFGAGLGVGLSYAAPNNTYYVNSDD